MSLMQVYSPSVAHASISVEEMEVALEEAQVSMESMHVLGNQYHALVSGHARLSAISLEDVNDNIVMVSVESVLADLSHAGVALNGIGFESFVETTQLESLDIALEGIISTIGDKIRKMGVGMRDFFTNQAKITGKIEEEADDIRERLKQGEDSAKTDKVTITRAHQLHLEGKTDKASIFKGLEVTTDLLDAIMNKYPQAYDKFISTYVKNYIKSSWFTLDVFNQVDAIDKGFKEINTLMEKELSVFGGKVTEFSGGKMLTTDYGPFTGVPHIKKVDKRKEVTAKKEVDVLTKDEIEDMLKACEKIAELIDKSQRGFLTAVRNVERILENTNKEMKGYDAGFIKKWMAKQNGRMFGYMNYGFVSQPTMEMVGAAIGIARAGLNYARVSTEAYV